MPETFGRVLTEPDHDWLRGFKRRDRTARLQNRLEAEATPPLPVEVRIAKIYGADIAPGAFVGEAKFWTWDADGEEFVEEDDDPIAVYDFMGAGVPEDMPVHLIRLGIFEGAIWLIQWPMRLLGKLEGALSVGGSATVGVWAWNGSTYADSGMNITAHDWLMKAGASAIASGKKCIIAWFPDSGRWIFQELECP